MYMLHLGDRCKYTVDISIPLPLHPGVRVIFRSGASPYCLLGNVLDSSIMRAKKIKLNDTTGKTGRPNKRPMTASLGGGGDAGDDDH